MFIGGFTLFEIESKATGVKNIIIYTLLWQHYFLYREVLVSRNKNNGSWIATDALLICAFVIPLARWYDICIFRSSLKHRNTV